MPGLVAFRRRWNVGSDDLVVPGLFLLVLHLSWLVVLVMLLIVGDLKNGVPCAYWLWLICVSYVGVLGMLCVLDGSLSLLATRGGILDTHPRRFVKYIMYLTLLMMLFEMVILSFGVHWLVYNYRTCPIEGFKQVFLGMVIWNWVIDIAILLTGWCVFDTAGRSWVKMKKYQLSMKESESRFQYKRKVLRAYQDSWDQRCKIIFCCIRSSDRKKNSFTDIARMLSDFFRDLDVVPSDVVAGLILLRKFQKIEQESNVAQRKNGIYEYLSGVPVTPKTKFLPLGNTEHYKHFEAVIHYMHFALAAYGWPLFFLTTPVTKMCTLCQNLSCQLCRSNQNVNGDNCCGCNYAALRAMLSKGEVSIIYSTFHVDVAETAFFVAVDYNRSKIVVSIRGTLSIQDVLTDLNAESETLPLNPPREDWLGHKGMVQAAIYMKDKLEKENILNEAFAVAANEKPNQRFALCLVGHSLGAGTAAILAILLRQNYPDLQCFAYSPPGGLLSLPAVQYTKSFVTSVVLGKDLVPRIGLHQLEALRADLINAIKRSKDPKWKIITCSVFCCGCASMPTSAVELKGDTATMTAYQLEKDKARAAAVHPNDSSISLTLHQPLYPPGSIIHVVRHHPSKTEQVLKKHDPVYQAIWANNTDFNEVLISPVMIQDHMPDKVLEALNKVITSLGPAKPQRVSGNNNNSSSSASELEHCHLLAGSSTLPSHRICLETSFTSRRTGTKDDIEIGRGTSHLPWEFNSLIPLQEQNSCPPAIMRRHSCEPIHDDWFGLAPLATPESFSEVSSISSRASSLFFGPKDSKPKPHCPVKESHSVRFDENVESRTDSRVLSPAKDHWNILSRIFKRKKKDKEEEEEKLEDKEEIKHDETVHETVNEIMRLDDSYTSTESSPLLSSLHLLTDQRLAEILGRPLATSKTCDDSITSSSFHSQELPENTLSSDSVTVNAEVHNISALRSESSVGGDSLLEDIERSLNINLSRTGSLAKLSLSRHGSVPKLTEVSIDIDDDSTKLVNDRERINSLGSSSSSKYLYPILHVNHGESSV
ncbi:sn1-specific diacylglycerol lipase alpha isoform X2 [Cimex lectularius]|uniref:Diacylglycerol lipase-alpha n=1 Tax=Cimex lectularius TaxID=79782 RepID=A0A8I6SIF5_CIMLE|nr:sn1-specific diacylglycerol lipase alpha isoform X2 [Cimex lectularius]